jgi:DNA-binding phage protein
MSAPGEMLEPVDAYALLRQAVERAGSQAAYARKVGISPQFLNDALQSRREIPPPVLRDLGLVRITRYLRKEPKIGG